MRRVREMQAANSARLEAIAAAAAAEPAYLCQELTEAQHEAKRNKVLTEIAEFRAKQEHDIHAAHIQQLHLELHRQQMAFQYAEELYESETRIAQNSETFAREEHANLMALQAKIRNLAEP